MPGVEEGQADAATLSGDHATGGPGRWRGGVVVPECAPGPADALEDAANPAFGSPADADADLADTFCRDGDAIVSPREVDPARVAMNADSLAALDDFILAALADSAASGAALAIVRRGQLVRLRGYGRLDRDPQSPPVTPASIFDLASLTKVVGTTSAVVHPRPPWPDCAQRPGGRPSSVVGRRRPCQVPRHDPPPAPAPRRPAPLPPLLPRDGGSRRLRGRDRCPPARLRPRRTHRLLRHRPHDGGLHRRSRHRNVAGRLPARRTVAPPRHGRHRLHP